MIERQNSAGTIRKLWPTETDKFRDHLLRLDKTNRRLRFAHGVSDAFIEALVQCPTAFGRRNKFRQVADHVEYLRSKPKTLALASA